MNVFQSWHRLKHTMLFCEACGCPLTRDGQTLFDIRHDFPTLKTPLLTRDACFFVAILLLFARFNYCVMEYFVVESVATCESWSRFVAEATCGYAEYHAWIFGQETPQVKVFDFISMVQV